MRESQPRPHRHRRTIVLFAIATLTLAACAQDDPPAAPGQAAPPPGATTGPATPGEGQQAEAPPVNRPEAAAAALAGTLEPALSLTIGDRSAPRTPPSGPAATTPLDETTTAALLGRLQPLAVEEGDAQAFALRPATIQPPRVETVAGVFPPPSQMAPPEDPDAQGALRVERWSPEGDVPMARQLSVTFSQPMVALGTHQQLSQAQVPVTLSPSIDGTWRWVGTRTLLFEPDPRFPMSSAFTATVAAGTESATGGALAQAASWSFRTPTVALQSSLPSGVGLPLQPTLYASFDQPIDPEAVLEHVKVKAGEQVYEVELLSQSALEALEEDDPARQVIKHAPQGTWLAFRTVEALPYDSQVVVVFEAGTPSQEGPRGTEAPQSFSFMTHGPLEVENAYCSYRDGDDGDIHVCYPGAAMSVYLSNPLDEAAFEPSMVQVTPEVEGIDVDLHDHNLQVTGRWAPDTRYTMTVSTGLRDVYGQALGSAFEVQFKTPPAEAPEALEALERVGDEQITLHPEAARAVTFLTIGYPKLRVRVFDVELEDWPALSALDHELKYERRTRARRDAPPGREVIDRTLEVDDVAGWRLETIDLTPALADGRHGQLLVLVEEVAEPEDHDNDPRTPPIQPAGFAQWVQATDLGVSVHSDATTGRVMVTSLRDGAPVSGVEVQAVSYEGVEGGRAQTDARGIARLDRAALARDVSYQLVARKAGDEALLHSHLSHGEMAAPRMTWHVFDDRHLYKPGEQARVKGWVRVQAPGPEGQLGMPPQSVQAVRYRLTDPRGNEVGAGEAPVNDAGGFDLTLALPDNLSLGWVSLHLTAVGAAGVSSTDWQHRFRVQEFRRPEFEVSASADPGPRLLGEVATVEVSAKYFSGEALTGATVEWTVSAQPGSYTPPGRSAYRFSASERGGVMPYYHGGLGGSGGLGGHGRGRIPMPYPGGGGRVAVEPVEHVGATGGSGEHAVEVGLAGTGAVQPMVLTPTATVIDLSRQRWTASASVLVHPSSVYVGNRVERSVLEAGEPLEVALIATDLDGQAVEGRPLQARAARMVWEVDEQDGQWKEVEKDVQTCEQTSAANPAECVFTTTEAGRYVVRAVVSDPEGRLHVSDRVVWVSGPGGGWARGGGGAQGLTIVADRELYEPGQTARLLVQSPLQEAHGLLMLDRDGVFKVEPFTVAGGDATLEVAVEEGRFPNLNAHVILTGVQPQRDEAGQAAPDARAKPVLLSAQQSLRITPSARQLTVAVEPLQRVAQPGDEDRVTVTITDPAGAPVEGVEVALVVVDEAVLALTGHVFSDPYDSLYVWRQAQLQTSGTQGDVLMIDAASVLAQREEALKMAGAASEGLGMMGYGRGGGSGNRRMQLSEGMRDMDDVAQGAMAREMAPGAPPPAEASAPGEAGAPIRTRSNFDALASFTPSLRTDAAGQATASFTLPDSLTRYRVVALVAGERRFGQGESSITARQMLTARPQPPRFLNFGDDFELPVVLHNASEAPLSVQVAARAAGATLRETHGQQLEIPPGERREVRFPATTLSAGTARFQVAVSGGAYADAAEVALPVWTPATGEAFATYGVVDEAAMVQPIQRPTDVHEQFGGLEITTTSTALTQLTDAFIYLVDYPYGCSEQIASRVLSVAVLKDMVAAFNAAAMPSEERLLAAVSADLDALAKRQNHDGGFAYWRQGDDSVPYVTAHVGHALARAERNGFAVNAYMKRQIMAYLRDIRRYIPLFYSEASKQAIEVYALYVLDQLGGDVHARARSLLSGSLASLSLESVGWLLTTVADDPAAASLRPSVLQHLANKAVETASAAHFTDHYSDGAYVLLYSNERTDGVVLEALIAADPQSTLIPKVVRGLMDARERGRWSNTQANAFALVALDRYFETYESTPPDMVARVWLGEQYAGDHAYQGRSTEQHLTEVPMRYLTSGPEQQPLTIAREGTGRLYYRVGMRYAPSDLKLPPAEHGFSVERAYEAIDDPADVRREANGDWHIKLGARVRVRLTMANPAVRYHVALVDRLPAGFEVVNPDLKGAQPVPPSSEAAEAGPPGRWRAYWGQWYDHQNLRDERVEAFTSYLWPGVHAYTYVVNATTPGHFIAPPTRAEEMYTPETFGRGGAERVIIE